MQEEFLVTYNGRNLMKVWAGSIAEVFQNLECEYGIHAESVINIEVIVPIEETFRKAKFSEITGIPYYQITYNKESDTYTVDLNA